jgi:hypothetical protein
MMCVNILTDIPQIPERVEGLIGPLSFLGNDNRAPRAHQAVVTAN